MNVPVWLIRLQQLLDRDAHLPHSRFASAATVRGDGRPANRTLAFRSFLEDGRLVFTSDARSEKAGQLAANPWMELCWYFTETRTQMRLLGTVEMEGKEGRHADARMGSWRERTEQSRHAFSWPDPGRALGAQDAFEQPCPPFPPAHFILLIFRPQQVDVLDLAPHPHRRTVHTWEDATWTETAVNP